MVVVVVVVVIRDGVGAPAGFVDEETGGFVLFVCEVGFSIGRPLLVVVGTGGVYVGAGRVRPRFRIASSRTIFFHLLTRVS